jgi:hypothetical protein
MSSGIWRILVALVILVHGIGHVLFLAPCLGMTQWGQAAHSWLLTQALGDGPTRAIGALLWLVVIVGFAAASVGLLGQQALHIGSGQAWWRPVASGAAGVSLLALALFASGISRQPLLSAGLMDVAILVALLWVRWPSADLVGA